MVRLFILKEKIVKQLPELKLIHWIGTNFVNHADHEMAHHSRAAIRIISWR